MKKSNAVYKKIRNGINLFAAVIFTLYIAYQFYLLFQMDTNKVGRILGLCFFAFIAIASYFSLIPLPPFRLARAALLIAGLSFNFIFKMLSADRYFYNIDFSNIPSVLNCAIFVFSQAALFILLLYYVIFRHNVKLNSNRKTVVALMITAIALYVLCLIMECVMILNYNLNIDSSIELTLLSRFLYCIGFVSIAVSFMIPVSEIDDALNPYINPENDVNDLDLVMSPDHKPHIQKHYVSQQNDKDDIDLVL